MITTSEVKKLPSLNLVQSLNKVATDKTDHIIDAFASADKFISVVAENPTRLSEPEVRKEIQDDLEKTQVDTAEFYAGSVARLSSYKDAQDVFKKTFLMALQIGVNVGATKAALEILNNPA